MEYLLALILTGGIVALLSLFVNEMMKKDNQIAELQHALIEAYTEIEFAKLGLMK